MRAVSEKKAPSCYYPAPNALIDLWEKHGGSTKEMQVAEIGVLAKDSGKIEKCWNIPEVHKNNTPDRFRNALQPAREMGLLPRFPFGADFTETEQRLIPAMEILKQ